MLKEKLQDRSNLLDAYKFYFKNFGEQPAFVNASKSIKDKLLEQMIREIGSRATGKPIAILTNKVFLEHKTLGIRHGACFMSGLLLSFFFITELGEGMMAAAKNPFDPDIKVAFFSSKMMGDGGSQFMPPEKEQSN